MLIEESRDLQFHRRISEAEINPNENTQLLLECR